MSDNRFVPTLLLASLGIIWGTSFLLIGIGLESLSALQVASLRISVAGVAFFPFLIYHIRKMDRKDIPYAILSGFLGNGIPAFLFALAQTRINSSTAGVLNATTPVFTTILAAVFFGMKIEGRKYLGIAVGFIGAVTVILETKGYIGEISYPHAGLIILATFFYGLNINLIKTKLSHYKSIVISSVPIGSLAIPALIMLFISDFPETVRNAEDSAALWRSVTAIGILGIIGTSMALVLFNRLIQLTHAVFASSVTYIIPMVAMLVGWMNGESVGLLQLAGLGAILLGIRLVNKRTIKGPLIR